MASVTQALPFRPEQPTVVEVSWKTGVLRSYNGKETRWAVHAQPRQAINHSYTLDAEELRQVRGLLYNDTDLVIPVPLWHEPFLTTGAATSGGTTVTGDFTDNDLTVGQQIYIDPEDGTRGEFQDLLSIVGSTLTITGGTWGQTYAAGSRIYPALQCRLRDSSKVGHAYGLSSMDVKLDSTEFYLLGGSGASLTTYQSLTLLDKKPLEGVGEDWIRRIEVIDFGGPIEATAGAPRSTMRRNLSYLIQTHSDLQYWKKFLDSILGRREPFFAPTWEDDLSLSAQPTGGASTVVVVNDPVFKDRFFDTGSAHQDLQFVDSVEGTFQRRVSSIVDNGTTSTLTLSSALPGPAVTMDISRISMIEQVRLASDTVRFTHYAEKSILELATTVIEQ